VVTLLRTRLAGVLTCSWGTDRSPQVQWNPVVHGERVEGLAAA
jgi:hypothetical protein